MKSPISNLQSSIINALALLLLLAGSAPAATLRWDDTNNPAGTGYLISNKVGAAWQYLAHTTNRTLVITLTPGTNTFSVAATNGLTSDPVTQSTNYPAKVINIIIEASDRPDGGWQTESNATQIVYVGRPATFVRARLEAQP